MIRTIVILSLFFFLASLAQLIYLHYVISHRALFNAKESLSLLQITSDASQEQIIEATRMKALVMLEAGNLDDLYHQANVLLMGRLWTSYIGFVTGMILAIVGATFILGKLKESVSELSGKTAAADFSFKSASPGLILAVLGTLLMITTIVTHHEINVQHAAVYIHDNPATNYYIPPALPMPKQIKSDSVAPSPIIKPRS